MCVCACVCVCVCRIFEFSLSLSLSFSPYIYRKRERIDRFYFKLFVVGLKTWDMFWILMSLYISCLQILFVTTNQMSKIQYIYIYIYIYIYMCVCVWLASSLLFKHVWLDYKDTFCLHNFIKFLDKCLGFRSVDKFAKIVLSAFGPFCLYKECFFFFLRD